MSSTHADFVTTLCTHRPSLLPIATSGEISGGCHSQDCASEIAQILCRRGRRSRNKVSVDESADGSLKKKKKQNIISMFFKNLNWSKRKREEGKIIIITIMQFCFVVTILCFSLSLFLFTFFQKKKINWKNLKKNKHKNISNIRK